MSDALILGIDGGGSKVLVALADKRGRILRRSRGRGVNPMDNPNWLQELEQHLLPFRDEGNLAVVAAALPAYGEVERPLPDPMAAALVADEIAPAAGA
ncbi:hypothetical protein ACCS33_08580, partial [Rhizobium ruizarguesonis]